MPPILGSHTRLHHAAVGKTQLSTIGSNLQDDLNNHSAGRPSDSKSDGTSDHSTRRLSDSQSDGASDHSIGNFSESQSDKSSTTSMVRSKLDNGAVREHLRDCNVSYGNVEKDKPKNLESVIQSLNRLRNDVGLDDQLWKQNLKDMRQANEMSVMQCILPTLLPVKDLWNNPILAFSCCTKWQFQEPLCTGLGRAIPDQAIGLTEAYMNSILPGLESQDERIRHLKTTREQYCPVLTMELKGVHGNEDEAVSQIQIYGAHMLKIQERTKKLLKCSRRSSDNVIQALSLILTHDKISVWGHWKVTRGTHFNCISEYLNTELAVAPLFDGERSQTLARNAVEWAWTYLETNIVSDLQRL